MRRMEYAKHATNASGTRRDEKGSAQRMTLARFNVTFYWKKEVQFSRRRDFCAVNTWNSWQLCCEMNSFFVNNIWKCSCICQTEFFGHFDLISAQVNVWLGLLAANPDMDGYIRRMSGFLQGAKDVILNNSDISVTDTGEKRNIVA